MHFGPLPAVIRSLAAFAIVAIGSSPVAAQAPPPAFPVTLQEAIGYAALHYPSVRASSARIAAQESSVDLARTAYLPRLDSSIQINRATRNNVAGLLLPGSTIPPISGPVSDATSASTIWGSAGGVLLSWEAVDFGSRGASVDLARTLVTRANATAALTRLDVGVKTAEAFLRLAAAQETARAARAHVARQQVFADAVAALVRNELRAGADDSRGQAELAMARIQVIQAEQPEQMARVQLAQWLGVDPSDVRIAAEPLLTASPPPLASLSPAAPSSVCCIGAICPRTLTVTPAGSSPVRATAANTSSDAVPRSVPCTFAVSVIIRCWL
jgi:outer membrane protein TolC